VKTEPDLLKMAACTQFITPEAGATETSEALRWANDTIRSLREENERLRKHVDELTEKIALSDCACSLDEPGDVCVMHSPLLRRAEAERDAAIGWIADEFMQNHVFSQSSITEDQAMASARSVVAARLQQKEEG
jgi:hypothetical protein